MRVVVYDVEGNSRAANIGRAMVKGLSRRKVPTVTAPRFNGKILGDVAIAYGWIHELTDNLFSKYREAGKHFVFVDLGYWNRSATGSHRVAVDDWDSLTNMRRGMPSDRREFSKVAVNSVWNPESKNIIVAGMSGKAARTHGYRESQWERETASKLKSILPDDWNVIIRAKPNKRSPKMDSPKIEKVLKDTFIAVSHHSNVSVDCLRAGVPYYAVKGVAMPLAITDITLEAITKARPPSIDQATALLNDISYVQWDLVEMANGKCWDYISSILGGLR